MADSLGATSYQYDALNHLVSVSDPFGTKIQYTCDATGNTLTETDQLGRFPSVTQSCQYAHCPA